jgi:hypothetical protein
MSSQYCPPDVNTGFIELIGPIKMPELQTISVNSYPLSISFAPRQTPPTLVGNRIDESTENTCTYKGQRFHLADVQICSSLHKGYILPNMNEKPVAELILTFASQNTSNNIQSLSGVLLCLPIYESGFPQHHHYLMQIIDPNIPSCKYSHNIGYEYNGDSYNKIDNTTLTGCIRSCCGDPNCIAYTFNNGTCNMKNSIQPINKSADDGYISGKVDHKQAVASEATCPKNGKNKDSENIIANLQTLFYEWDGDLSQSSLSYKSCFETLDENNSPVSRSLYISVFPTGIHLTQQGFQQLLLQLGGKLATYNAPPAIRNAEQTVRTYKFDDNGNKTALTSSAEGIIYRTSLSSCTDDFINRFEFFTKPPRLPTLKIDTNSCPYYTTTQYKCVPFNQLNDLSGNYVIPGGNTTLQTILDNQTIEMNNSKPQMSSQDMAVGIASIIAPIAVIGICLGVGSFIVKNATSR